VQFALIEKFWELPCFGGVLFYFRYFVKPRVMEPFFQVTNAEGIMSNTGGKSKTSRGTTTSSGSKKTTHAARSTTEDYYESETSSESTAKATTEAATEGSEDEKEDQTTSSRGSKTPSDSKMTAFKLLDEPDSENEEGATTVGTLVI
jgi:hypothetical protein